MNDYEREGNKYETVELVRNRDPRVLPHCRRPNAGEGRYHRTAKAGAIHAIQVVPIGGGGGTNREKYIGAGPADVEG